jgi:DNA-binding IclR family transcriptional regulator
VEGFATDRQESTDGLACVAVPVIAGGHAVAAVSVAFPASAGTGSVFIGPLRQAAAIASSPVIRRAAPLTDS